MTATGTALGTYSLTFELLATDGTTQAATVTGVTNTGATSSYQLSFSPAPGASSSVTLMATFQSTLADISNSFKSGLINSRDVALLLSAAIQVAANAETAKNGKVAKATLEAFELVVRRAPSKQISSVAAQILLADAQSLINQL